MNCPLCLESLRWIGDHDDHDELYAVDYIVSQYECHACEIEVEIRQKVSE